MSYESMNLNQSTYTFIQKKVSEVIMLRKKLCKHDTRGGGGGGGELRPIHGLSN